MNSKINFLIYFIIIIIIQSCINNNKSRVDKDINDKISLLITNHEMDSALFLLNSEFKKGTEDPYIHKTLFALYLKKKQYQNSINVAKKFLTFYPNDCDMKLGLALNYICLSKQEEANQLIKSCDSIFNNKYTDNKKDEYLVNRVFCFILLKDNKNAKDISNSIKSVQLKKQADLMINEGLKLFVPCADQVE
jgi:tetratricopeptide (TPR) repeat protein